MREIAKLFLKARDIGIVSEVKLRDFGDIDWVAYSYNNKSGKIVDFCGIEIASDATTQTGELVKGVNDFMEKKRLTRRYNYGLNTYNTIKLSFTQILFKGQVFEKWGKKYVWVLQDALFTNFIERFSLDLKESLNENQLIFYVVKMVEDKRKNLFDIKQSKIYSTSIHELLKAYNKGGEYIPPIKDFIEAIKRKAGDISQPSRRTLNQFK